MKVGVVQFIKGAFSTGEEAFFRNLPNVHCLHQGELNTYDVLDSDVVVFTEATLPSADPAGSGGSAAEVSGEEQ